MSGGGEIQALVNYYARAGYARHLQTVCGEVLRKRANDPTLQFWRTFGMIMEGSYSEAIMQLEGLMGCVVACERDRERPGGRRPAALLSLIFSSHISLTTRARFFVPPLFLLSSALSLFS
jgi:hypothetical protein